MRNRKWVAVAVIALLLPLAANAGHRKPGLWAVTVQMNFTKGGPQIPPEQLEKMKQMGMQSPFSGPHTYNRCLTPEQAAQDDHPDGGKNCQMQNASWSGNTFTADIMCTTPQGGQTHGKIKAVANGEQSYTGSVHIEGTDPGMGGDFAMDNQIQGQWLRADCGGAP